jgi:hypothetical protein
MRVQAKELLTGDLNYCKHSMPKFRSAKVGLKTLLTKNWCKKSYTNGLFFTRGAFIFAIQRAIFQ